MQEAKGVLAGKFADVTVPQSRPLSGGEVLGCTAPSLPSGIDALVFIADGRFHLEAIMIANPNVPAFRYDPYTSRLIREQYDHRLMRHQRRDAIENASRVKRWGVIMGSLGRQGNPAIVEKLGSMLRAAGKCVFRFIMSEIFPDRLKTIEGIDAWVQVGCPRLSIDWGNGFQKPVLTPYEAMVAIRQVSCFWKDDKCYPMDYYAKDGGPWSNSYHKPKRSP